MKDSSSLNKKKTEEKAAENGKKVMTKAQREQRKKKIRTRALVIILASLAVLLLVLIGIYHWVVDHYVEKLNIVTEETGLIFETDHPETEEVVELNGEMDANNLPLICDTKNVKNILLLAVDSRGKEAGLSDSMILLSINRKTEKIVLCSFLRDILAHFPEEPKSPMSGKYSKLTHAHSYGGPELTMAVLKETFNIDVEYYAKINFYSFIEMIDVMGGVDIYMTSSEIWWINDDFLKRDETLEIFSDYKKTPIPGGEGMKHLNGLQALGHARNRTIGSDFARTQRQRNLLEAMAKKATTLSLSQLNQLLNSILPMITTNMPKSMIKEFIGDVPSYLTYEVASTRIPGDGLYTSKDYSLVPDLEKNCMILYEEIYGEKPKGKE